MERVRLIFVSCILFNIILICDSGKILVVVPTPSISHQVVFRPLTQELAKRGHEVTYITTDPAFPKGQTPPNLVEIDLHDLSYGIWRKEALSIDRSKYNHFSLTAKYLGILSDVFEAQLNETEFKNAIHGKKYDLIILEAVARPALGLSYVLKAPVILMSSVGHFNYYYDLMGVPTHPILYPSTIRRRLYNLTVWEKVYGLWTHYYFNYMYENMVEKDNEIIRRHFGPNAPTVDELRKNVDMLFVNIHPILDDNIPVPPGVVYIWGIHRNPEKSLPMDLKSYLDSSKNGVIYMSFGTNVDPTLLQKEKVQMFNKVFSELPYDVLWKWNGDELPGKPENVKIGKWFPQSDMLRHPKIKLFITQGGIQSTDEAIKARVPLIGIPILGDQYYNTEKYVHVGIGLRLDWDTITEAQIRNAINAVLNDDSYRKNIERLDVTMRDEPMDGLQRAVWWTEYVLRHSGAKHLRAPAACISWIDYLEIKLIGVIVFILFLVLFSIISLINWVFRSIRSESKKKRE